MTEPVRNYCQWRMSSFIEIHSCIRGYHIYQGIIWTPIVNEQLTCRSEPGNIQDPHAVAMIKGVDVVGHVPRKISTMCSMFLRRAGSTIVCTVTGLRRHSVDLVQGGMEVPCKYTCSLGRRFS